MKKIVLNIKGMHCGSCTVLVRDALTELAGVKTAVVDLKKAVISYDEKVIDDKKLIKVIETEGYSVTKESDWLKL